MVAWGGPDVAQLALVPGGSWMTRGPMNGQAGRRALLRSVVAGVRFDYVVETGTFRGGSTAFLADISGCTVYTVESDPVAGAYAGRLFAGRPDVVTAIDDSRHFLGRLAAELATAEPALFYLDAHWDEEDLPLWGEIETIFSKWAHPVVVIDDFEVPGDDGYGFDHYGPGRALCLAELVPRLVPGVDVWSPTLPSSEETGERRGCAVLVRSSPPTGWAPGDLLRMVHRSA